MDWLGFPPMWILMELGMGVAFWIAGIAWYHSSVYMEASTFLAFDSSKWRFDESTVETIDLLIQEGAIEVVGKTSGGRHVYKVGPFASAISYLHPNLGELVFEKAIWIMDRVWDKEFFFKGGGEIWYKGIPVTHANCEGLVLHVMPNWEEKEGEFIPICVVADSTAEYQETLNNASIPKNPIISEEIVEARLSVLKGELLDWKFRARNAESDLKAVLNDSFNVEESIQKRIDAMIRRHGNIMRIGKPLSVRIINMKTGAVILTVAIIALITYMFFTGSF